VVYLSDLRRIVVFMKPQMQFQRKIILRVFKYIYDYEGDALSQVIKRTKYSRNSSHIEMSSGIAST
jgi:hypothetical protein